MAPKRSPRPQDPDNLRTTVAKFYAPGAVLYHYLTRASSAEDLYRVYRCGAAAGEPASLSSVALSLARHSQGSSLRSYVSSFISRPVLRDIIIDTRVRNPQPRHVDAALLRYSSSPSLAPPRAPSPAPGPPLAHHLQPLITSPANNMYPSLSPAPSRSSVEPHRHALAAAEGLRTGPAPPGPRPDPASVPPPPPGSCAAVVWLDQHVTVKLVPGLPAAKARA
jgi:hypothetical protein